MIGSVMIKLMALIILVNCKVVEKDIILGKFKTPLRAFLSKFDVGVGYGSIQINYRLKPIRDAPNVRLYSGVIIDDKYDQFMATDDCEKQIDLYHGKYTIDTQQTTSGTKSFHLNSTIREHIWYAYVVGCQSSKENQQLSIHFTLKMMNNNSHFGQDQQFVIPYIILLVVWVILIIKYAIPIFRTFISNRPEAVKCCIYISALLMGLSYFYRLIHISLYSSDGKGLYLFYTFYLVLKSLGQSVNSTIIVAIGWGWSLIHLRKNDLYIVMALLVTILNITGLVLNTYMDESQNHHHHYDNSIGICLIFLKSSILIVFIVGIMKSLAQSAGNMRSFIKKFGIVGSIYLSSWPIAVFLAQLLLPYYMQKQFITFIEQICHSISIMLMCHMMVFPESTYRKVSITSEDNPFFSNQYKNI